MAIINTLRMRNILVRGEIAREEPADEFVELMDDEFAKARGEFASARDDFVTHDAHEASEHRVLASIESMRREMAQDQARQARENEQRARENAERDRQIHNHITIGIGLIIGAITIATAVISIVIVVVD